MKRKTAAEYLDLTEAAFDREVYNLRLPAPVKFGGRDHWRKDAIDAMLAAIGGDGMTEVERRFWDKSHGQAA